MHYVDRFTRDWRGFFKKPLTAFMRRENGTTAIEFAVVATPFLMFILGLMAYAMFFFVMNSIEKGMDQTSRLIRTGQAVTQNMTVDQFKQSICNGAGVWVKCNALQIFVKRFSDWGSVTQQPCLDASKNVISNPAKGTDPIATYSGTASDIVLVTACYKWTVAAKLPYVHLGNMKDGSMMMQAVTAFRSEPYAGS